jgi:hypothetical protein
MPPQALLQAIRRMAIIQNIYRRALSRNILYSGAHIPNASNSIEKGAIPMFLTLIA